MAKKGSYFSKHKEQIGSVPQQREHKPPLLAGYQKQFEEGQVILIDKPLHWTSFDVVRKVRNAIRIKKVGHAGTLDPLATGLLIICTGKFTKKINEYMAQQKEYSGSFTLGATTPTYDRESEPENHKPIPAISGQQLQELALSFVGPQMQIPPIYSAIKKEGTASYELARRGMKVELQPRPITIYDFSVDAKDFPVVHFKVSCSTGTYIRSLAHDFGAKLGCGAYLSALRRTRIGNHDVKDAQGVEAFLASLDAHSEKPAAGL